MKARFLAIVVFLISTLFGQTNIAVIDFEGKNVSKDDASAITDRLRLELFLSGKFVVLEREKMDAILKEQGFQQSGCTSDACAVEVGQLLAVEQMVVGSISKVGQTYSVTARLVGVEKGSLIGVGTCDLKGDIGDVMTCLSDVAAQLAGKQPVLISEPAQTQNTVLKNQKVTTANKPPTNMIGIPDWYLNPPQYEEAYYEAGYAAKLSMSSGKVASDASARNAIYITVEIKVSNILNNFMRESGIGADTEALEFTSSVSKQVANTARTRCKIVKRNMKADGDIYHAFSLAEYSLNSLVQHTLYEARKQKALYNEAKANLSFEDLEKEIQKLNTTQKP